MLLGKPYVWGSIYRFDGQASVFWAEHGPCYRCLYPEPPPPGMVPSCAEGGVLGVLCASIGAIQVTEAIKLLTGIGDPLVGGLMVYDALEMSYRKIQVRKDPNCAICGENPTVTALIDYDDFCGAVSDEAPRPSVGSTITVDRAQGVAQDAGKPIDLVDVREPAECEIVRIPGAVLVPKGDILNGNALGEPAAGPPDRPLLQVRRPSREAGPPRSRRPASRTRCTSRVECFRLGSARSTRASARPTVYLHPRSPTGGFAGGCRIPYRKTGHAQLDGSPWPTSTPDRHVARGDQVERARLSYLRTGKRARPDMIAKTWKRVRPHRWLAGPVGCRRGLHRRDLLPAGRTRRPR